LGDPNGDSEIIVASFMNDPVVSRIQKIAAENPSVKMKFRSGPREYWSIGVME
jgi:hypothetical protein